MLDFSDIARREEDVKVGDVMYKLREATGKAATAYRNAAVRCARMDDGKVTRVEGIAGIESYLVSLCLFEVLQDGTVKDTPVLQSVLEAWPVRVQKRCFDWIKENSEGLDEKETEEGLRASIAAAQAKLAALAKGDPAKNSLSGTADGST